MIKSIRELVGPQRASFLFVLVSVITMDAIMSGLNPLILKYIFDEGVIKKDFVLFIWVAVGFMCLATAHRFFSLWSTVYVQNLKNKVLKRLMEKTLDGYYKFPYQQIIKNSTGYYTSRIYDEPTSVSGSSIDLSFAICSAVASSLVAFGVVLYLSLKATMALILTVPFLMFLSSRYRSAIKKHSREEKESEGELRGTITRAVEAYRTVNIFSLHLPVRTAVVDAFEKYMGSLNARVKNSAKHNAYGAMFMSYGEMMVVIVCGYAILKGEMSFGGFMAYMNAFWIAAGNMRTLIQRVPEISKNSVALERAAEFVSYEAPPKKNPVPPSGVSFRSAAFGFDDKLVFSDLTFSVAKGERLLLNGRNGAGKSTVANVLTGFLEPQRGSAQILELEDISACIAPYHFIPGTVRDNLCYDSLSPSDRKYLDVLLSDFSLSESLEKRPEDLSAGQKKKLEVVMGLMKAAELYVFDEPLANVDVESKDIIMTRIFERAENSALVVIMHGDEDLQKRFTRAVSLM